MCILTSKKLWYLDHNILNFHGFRGLINQWFFSYYLNNRTQTTQIADHISNKAAISFGLPQGFVLGPRLFLLYVNDIHQCSTKLKFYLFAEKNLKVLETVVNTCTELCKLYDWLTSNNVTLNIYISKSNFVIFHPSKKRLIKNLKYCYKLKRALRIINFSDRLDHAIPLFIDANVLPLNFLYHQTLSSLMHKNAIKLSESHGNKALLLLVVSSDSESSNEYFALYCATQNLCKPLEDSALFLNSRDSVTCYLF